MSTIDEIMEAIQQAADAMDDCLDEGLRDLIAAALADARREGAEQMREVAADCAINAGRGSLAGAITALPLPTGTSQSAAATFEAWWDSSKTAATPDTFRGWEESCRQAWEAGQRANRIALPTGPRQAVHLSHSEIAEAFLSRCPAHLRGDHDVRDMQARPDVMELGRAIETAVLAANGLETK